MLLRLLSISLFLAHVLSAADAQSIQDHLTIAPVPNWVTPIQVPSGPDHVSAEKEVNYLLVEEQVRVQEKTSDIFLRQSRHLLTPNAVENNATISVDFDPAYHHVTFHLLQRTRNGESTDILDPQLFDLYRMETDRERLIYNGDMQVSYLIPDVRVGDIIEYAYSISGRNPATEDHFSGYFQHAYGVPIERHYERLIVPNNKMPRFMSQVGIIKPVVTEGGQTTEFVWDAQRAAVEGADGNLPPHQAAYPSDYYSSYKDWSEVGQYFSKYFEVSQQKPDELVNVARDIKASHTDHDAQLREALDFVQREIRYLGIELGIGGYIPRQPEEVLKNRFGDCKDMTLLLITLLDELGIRAQPLLVSAYGTDHIDKLLPSHTVFDHVIVMAELDGSTFYLDPTRGTQVGDLYHLQQGDFGKGVVVAENGPGMIDAIPPRPLFWREFEDEFDLVTDPEVVTLTSTSIYSAHQADTMLNWYRRQGHATAEKSFFEHYQNLFPQIEQIAPLETRIDEDHGIFELIGHYRIPEAWTPGQVEQTREFYTSASDLLSDMPQFIGADRTLPASWVHPIRTQQSLKFILDDTWHIEESQIVITNGAFEFRNVETFQNNIYENKINYSSQASSVSAEEYKSTMADLRRARDLTGVTLTINDGAYSNSIWAWLGDEDEIETNFQLWFFGTVFLSLIGTVLLRDRGAEWRTKHVFYPISLLKFTLLTAVSIGVYPIFWTFKQWQWVRDGDGEDIGPILRAFFWPYTSFSLFLRMAKKEGGFAWFRPVSIFLGIILLVGVAIDRFVDSYEDMPMFLMIFSFSYWLAWVPVAAQVNCLNGSLDEKHPDYEFAWPSIVFLLALLPIAGFTYYGMFVLITEG